MRPVYLIAHFALVNVSSALVVIMGTFTVALIAHAPHVKKSCKESNKRYQNSKKGRINNALRQQRFRERLRNNVTDHGSQVTHQDALLLPVKNRSEKWVDRQEKGRMKCCCCH